MELFPQRGSLHCLVFGTKQLVNAPQCSCITGRSRNGSKKRQALQRPTTLWKGCAHTGKCKKTIEAWQSRWGPTIQRKGYSAPKELKKLNGSPMLWRKLRFHQGSHYLGFILQRSLSPILAVFQRSAPTLNSMEPAERCK